jgi:hypothetical protein
MTIEQHSKTCRHLASGCDGSAAHSVAQPSATFLDVSRSFAGQMRDETESSAAAAWYVVTKRHRIPVNSSWTTPHASDDGGLALSGTRRPDHRSSCLRPHVIPIPEPRTPRKLLKHLFGPRGVGGDGRLTRQPAVRLGPTPRKSRRRDDPRARGSALRRLRLDPPRGRTPCRKWGQPTHA